MSKPSLKIKGIPCVQTSSNPQLSDSSGVHKSLASLRSVLQPSFFIVVLSIDTFQGPG